MYRLNRIVLIVLVLLVISLTVGTLVQAQEDACFNTGGTWDAEDERCVIRSSIEISLDYPLWLEEEHPTVADAIRQWFQDVRRGYVEWFTDLEVISPASATWFLYASYEEYRFSEDVVSFVYTVSDYTGGAHPNRYFQSFTFDLANADIVTLDDVLTDDALATISPLVQADLIAQQTDFADEEWITRGTGEEPANYSAFALSEDSLIFFFAPYQVAAYAAGDFSVSIPLSEINAVLKPEFQR